MDDPRLYIAEVYKTLKGDAESKKQFEEELNNCEGPEHAISICMSYLAMANN